MKNLLKSTIYSTLFILMLISTAGFSQRIDWSTVNLEKEYKRNAKVSGAVTKSLKNKTTFITEYKVTKYVEQKGSNNKGGGAAIFAHAGLTGITEQAYQKMVDDLYSHLVEGLKSVGVTMANADMIANSETAKSLANGKNEFAGTYPGGPTPDKTTYGDRVEIFRPREGQVYKEGIAGRFYYKLASKEDVNIISVQYFVQFAGFERARGYKGKSLTTFPLLVITPIITISTPKGKYSVITYGKTLNGNNDWGAMAEKGSKDFSSWGLSSSADYAIHANEQAYINEVSSIVKAVQNDIINVLREELL